MTDQKPCQYCSGKKTGYQETCTTKLHPLNVETNMRCKDCNAWKRNVGIADSPNGHCFEHDIDTNGQDFCSDGERRGE